MGTPAANQLEVVLSEKFPGIRFGRVNCRFISGSTIYSQHSWNNARDIYPPEGVQYLTSNDGEYRAFLDEVWDFIEANQEALNIRVKLWQVRNHYNHIHVDFWPRGWSTPPCADGAPRYKYPNGDVEPTATLINTYEDDMANQETSNPAFQPAFDQALEVGMFSEHTDVSDIITAEKLAVFLDRVHLLGAEPSEDNGGPTNDPN